MIRLLFGNLGLVWPLLLLILLGVAVLYTTALRYGAESLVSRVERWGWLKTTEQLDAVSRQLQADDYQREADRKARLDLALVSPLEHVRRSASIESRGVVVSLVAARKRMR